jgi:uncharacterized phage protein (TIGR01671 family)
MRTTKFRGLKIAVNEWVYGSLILINIGDQCIVQQKDTSVFNGGQIVGWCFRVRRESVGEFTGLKDKNGIDIYEGDILKVELFTKLFFISFGKSEKWGACFCVESNNSITFLTKNWADTSEVIGNISQNPELLQP